MSVLSIDVCTVGKVNTRQEVCSRRRDPKWPGALRLSANGFNGVETGFASLRPRRIRRYAGSVCTALMEYALIVPPRLHVIITGAPSVLVDDLYVAKPGLDKTGARIRARLICKSVRALHETQDLPRRRGEGDRK